MNRRPPSDTRETISELTTGRLSVYLRCLNYLESMNQRTVSSHEMAQRFHLNSAQIRKDLACFGEFGTRGVGYDVAKLKEQLVKTLGIDRTRSIVIIGAGNLGMALADYRGFNSSGFHIVALFDTDREKIGRITRSGIPVMSPEKLSSIVHSDGVEIGIIAVNAENAQQVYDDLADAGVCAVLNFAPVQIRLRSGVKVKSVDLRINLESLSYHLKNVEDGVDVEEE
ncbi:MAG TPA: redox-sensing transcriptional repressor Rex [Thermoanaerobaculia bacterium]|jgi:redox-sensing transcriptional repressor|nr:redox-sensing transcriptional repressor Rex [Thermoanaerobaculia bacterium]